MALPIQRGLTDSVGKAEGLDALQVRGRKRIHQLERSIPRRILDCLSECLQLTLLRVEHHQDVRNFLRPSPTPRLGSVRSLIPQTVRAIFLAPHAGEKLVGESGDHAGRKMQRFQTGAGERHLHRGWRSLVERNGVGNRRRSQPCRRRASIANPQQQEAGLDERGITEAYQALHVAVVHGIHCCCSLPRKSDSHLF